MGLKGAVFRETVNLGIVSRSRGAWAVRGLLTGVSSTEWEPGALGSPGFLKWVAWFGDHVVVMGGVKR